MPVTLFGRLRDQLGHAQSEDVDDNMRLRTRSWAVASDEFASDQYGVVPITLGHVGEPLGVVSHLELRETDQSLWLVAELDDDADRPGELFLSSELGAGPGA